MLLATQTVATDCRRVPDPPDEEKMSPPTSGLPREGGFCHVRRHQVNFLLIKNLKEEGSVRKILLFEMLRSFILCNCTALMLHYCIHPELSMNKYEFSGML
ncbi:hypothetical protein ILYODFUR_038538 [Ilyodon furcidens]|uniref:Uncharacterized protein n=1 Tax=Ilyodon furcidens TaxID=33524 RepID=A0ABV0T3X5_9TELE